MPLVILLVVIAALGAVFLGGQSLLSGGSTSGNCPPPAPSASVAAFAQAIAFAEGSNPAWNNPGDLTKSFGYPTSGTVNSAGVLAFTSCVDGWNALYQQITDIINGTSIHSLGDTLATFGLSYSGNDPNWASNVASKLGVSTQATLGSILS